MLRRIQPRDAIWFRIECGRICAILQLQATAVVHKAEIEAMMMNGEISPEREGGYNDLIGEYEGLIRMMGEGPDAETD